MARSSCRNGADGDATPRRSRRPSVASARAQSGYSRPTSIFGTRSQSPRQPTSQSSAACARRRGSGATITPQTAEGGQFSDEELASRLRYLPSADAPSQGPTLRTPVLDGVLAAPPQGWDADVLRRLSWLGWQMHQVNDALENTDYWFRATITTPEHNVPITKGNYQRCEETFRKQVRAASKRCATSSRGSRASMLAAVRWARAHGPRPMSRHDPRLGRADSRRWATPRAVLRPVLLYPS
jgi:hypothetical protein